MNDRDNWWHLYLVIRSEILGFAKDELLRTHLPRIVALRKGEGSGLEDVQMPSFC